MTIIKDWEGKDELFTDEERVETFTKLLATREKLAVYNDVGIKRNAGTRKYAKTVKIRDSNLESIKRLKKKIEYYSQAKEDQR